MEKKYKRIPFDLEMAKAITKGEKERRVVTRDGNPVRIIYWDYKSKYECPIIALVDNDVEAIRTYKENGKNEIFPNVNLFLEVPDEQEFKEGDVVVFRDDSGDYLSILKSITDTAVNLCALTSKQELFSSAIDVHCNMGAIRLATSEERQQLIDVLKKDNSDKAREWFNSSDSSLKEVTLQAFSEEELKPSFKDIKTFEDACEVLGINSQDIGCLIADPKKDYHIYVKTKASRAALRLNIIRQALNKGYKMSLTKGDVYYPQIKFVTQKSTFYNGELKIRVNNFKVDDEEYSLLGGYAIYGSNAGLGYFSSNNGMGYSPTSVGFLGCASREIAEHMSKYFAKEIFEVMYSDFIDFEWIN